MILKSIFLLLLLSLEATVGLPLFFLYMTWVWFDQWSITRGVVMQFVIALLLALFYDLSWPVLVGIVLGSYMLRKQIRHIDHDLLFWLLYLVVVALFAYLVAIDWQLLSVVHILLFFSYTIYMRSFHQRLNLKKGLWPHN